LFADKFVAVLAAVTLVEKVILSHVTTLAPENHQEIYQYVVLSLSHHICLLACDRFEAVFALVTDVEKVILSAVTTCVDHHESHQHIYQ
jgi:hypothetical protein